MSNENENTFYACYNSDGGGMTISVENKTMWIWVSDSCESQLIYFSANKAVEEIDKMITGLQKAKKKLQK